MFACLSAWLLNVRLSECICPVEYGALSEYLAFVRLHVNLPVCLIAWLLCVCLPETTASQLVSWLTQSLVLCVCLPYCLASVCLQIFMPACLSDCLATVCLPV